MNAIKYNKVGVKVENSLIINIDYDLSTWKMKNGELISVRSMSDAHLQSVIYLLNDNIARSQSFTKATEMLKLITPPTPEFEASDVCAQAKDNERHLRICTMLEELCSRNSPIYSETIDQLKNNNSNKSYLLN